MIKKTSDSEKSTETGEFTDIVNNQFYEEYAEEHKPVQEINPTDTPNFIKPDNISEKNSLVLPGFRSGVWWKKLLASIYFFVIGYFFVKSVSSYYLDHVILGLSVTIFFILFFYILPLNAFNIHSRLPLFKKKQFFAGYVVTFFIWFGLFFTLTQVAFLYEHYRNPAIKINETSDDFAKRSQLRWEMTQELKNNPYQ